MRFFLLNGCIFLISLLVLFSLVFAHRTSNTRKIFLGTNEISEITLDGEKTEGRIKATLYLYLTKEGASIIVGEIWTTQPAQFSSKSSISLKPNSPLRFFVTTQNNVIIFYWSGGIFSLRNIKIQHWKGIFPDWTHR